MMNIVMRRLLFFILVILIFSAREAISEEAVVHGVKYSGEVRVRVPVPGISFIVPLEWEGFLSQDEDIFFLLSDTKPGYMCATWKTGTSPEDMRDYLYQYLPGEDDQILVPAGLSEADECGAAVKYTSGIGEDQCSGEAIAIVSDSGIACAFFAVGPSEYESYYSRILSELADSLVFSIAGQESEGP